MALWGWDAYLADQIKDYLASLAFAIPFTPVRGWQTPHYVVEEGEVDDLQVVIVPSFYEQDRDEHATDAWNEDYSIEVGIICKVHEPTTADEADTLDLVRQQIVEEVRKLELTAPPAVCIHVNKGKPWPIMDTDVLAQNNIYLSVTVFTFRRLDQ